MISVEEALNQILATIAPLSPEKISLMDALGRVVGEDVIASRDIPPRDNSAMDGYAVRFADIRKASQEKPISLTVIEDIPAGTIPQKAVGPGEASRIMTGAPVPDGADTVVRMEDTHKGDHTVAILHAASRGQDIRLSGEDVRRGEIVIPCGSIVRPADVGMLASLGRSFVTVFQRPLVAILATGDELVDIDEAPSSWKIVNSNSYSVAAQVRECGASPLLLGIAKDRREDLMEKFRAAMRADIIISSGGVSVGDYDLVKDIMKEVGNRMKFWQVAMKPGKPLAFGAIGGIPVFGLPGNPVSSMVSFEQFIRPALLKMMGYENLFRRAVKATLNEDIVKSKGARHFIRGSVTCAQGRYRVTTTGEQGSGILKSMVRANGLIVLPEDVGACQKGDEVTVQLLDNSLELTPQPEYL